MSDFCGELADTTDIYLTDSEEAASVAVADTRLINLSVENANTQPAEQPLCFLLYNGGLTRRGFSAITTAAQKHSEMQQSICAAKGFCIALAVANVSPRKERLGRNISHRRHANACARTPPITSMALYYLS